MKTLELKLKNSEGKVEKFHLRLTAGGQKVLKEQFEEDVMTIIFSAIGEIDKAITLLETALNYRDNDNSITDGEEFYDLLVDNDVCGSDGFAKIFTDIAVNSGIIKKDQANAIMNTVNNAYDDVFNELEAGIPTPKEEADA